MIDCPNHLSHYHILVSYDQYANRMLAKVWRPGLRRQRSISSGTVFAGTSLLTTSMFGNCQSPLMQVKSRFTSKGRRR